MKTIIHVHTERIRIPLVLAATVLAGMLTTPGQGVAMGVDPEEMGMHTELTEHVSAKSGVLTFVHARTALGQHCNEYHAPNLVTIQQPSHGKMVVRKEMRQSTSDQCGEHYVETLAIYYQSAPKFAGTDEITLDFIGNGGYYTRVKAIVDVAQ